MFQLRRRTERPNSSLRKSGSVDDVKVPRILPAVAQSPGILITQLNSKLIHIVTHCFKFRRVGFLS